MKKDADYRLVPHKDEVIEAEIVKPETPPENTKGDDCSVCRFFFPDPEEGGYCHRYAPRAVVSGLLVDDEIAGIDWPWIPSTDWCGEGERTDGTKF